MHSEICSLNAERMRKRFAGEKINNDKDIVLNILKSKKTELKREEIVQEYRNVENVTVDLASQIVSSALSSLQKDSKVINTHYGYWKIQ